MEFFSATILTLGLGFCEPKINGNIYAVPGRIQEATVAQPLELAQQCSGAVGKIAIEEELVRFNEHNSISLELEHLSIFGNGEPFHGDRGTEFLFLEYKYRF